MSARTLLTTFFIAIILDLIVTPTVGGTVWLPYFSLLLLPFIFTVAPYPIISTVFFLETAIIWLSTEVNIGIIVFSLGMLLLFERWFVPTLLHTGTWQATIIIALGIPLFGILFVMLAILLPGDVLITTSRLVIGFTITTIASIVATALLKRRYAQ